MLPIAQEGVPTSEWQPPTRRCGAVQAPPRLQAPALFSVATRDTKKGTSYLKIVNCAGSAVPVHIKISGGVKVAEQGESIVISGSGPLDTNSIREQNKVVPVTTSVAGLGKDFKRTFPPYSVTILKLNATAGAAPSLKI